MQQCQLFLSQDLLNKNEISQKIFCIYILDNDIYYQTNRTKPIFYDDFS